MMEQRIQKSRNLSKINRNEAGEEGITYNETADSQKPYMSEVTGWHGAFPPKRYKSK